MAIEAETKCPQCGGAGESPPDIALPVDHWIWCQRCQGPGVIRVIPPLATGDCWSCPNCRALFEDEATMKAHASMTCAPSGYDDG